MAGDELPNIVTALRDARRRWRDAHRRWHVDGRELPSRELLAEAVQRLAGALFPMRLGPPDLQPGDEDYYVGHTLGLALAGLRQQAALELRHEARLRDGDDPADADARIAAFAARLPAVRALLDSDVIAAYQGDPAARSVDEVLLCYPGLHALISHRLAHELYAQGLPLIARVIAEQAHAQTGIDIHPGAQIGAGCFIDHGTGVVVGETAVLGERVRIYQNVTLGAKSIPTDAAGHARKGQPRHPIVESDVVIYAGATVLGRITIGQGSVIGGNVWLTRSLPPGSRIAQAQSQAEPQAEPAS